MAGASAAAHLSLVVVSWQSGPELAECVRSFGLASAAGRLEIELIVVDNASTAFPQAEITAAWPGVRLIRNEANRGFGPAANQGAEAATGRIVLFLNPDTRAVGDPLTPLLEAFDAHPDAVAVAPRLLDSSGGDLEGQSCFQLRHLPTLGRAVRELLLIDRAFPHSRAARRARYLDRDRSVPFAVEQPAAAALAVRRDVFERIGGFDGTFVPAWFEDVDLCARLLQHGKILYWPSSQFIHEGGGAAAALGYDQFLPIYYCNAIRFWRKHHGMWATLAYRALVCAGMVLRMLVVALGDRVPASKRHAWMAYFRVLRKAMGLSGVTR